MAESLAFEALCAGAKKWVYEQNWSDFRDIQERAIEPIKAGDRDLVIAAATAAGKTEAAFLPAVSRVCELQPEGVGILYVSPLKALINDQYRRMLGLAELCEISITPWHGDVGQAAKQRLKKHPDGILLITPESLESLLLNSSDWTYGAMSTLCYVIIDEYHAFLGTERGCQLQSILRRLEFLTGRKAPRIALSATLGDMKSVATSLRPEGGLPCQVIESTSLPYDLKVQLRGYEDPQEPDEKHPEAFGKVTEDLYRKLRGSSHLIFANSRQATEAVALDLSERCVASGVPNEFFPHHGNLSKELREDLERRMQEDGRPTSAVCTVTLELGIDIGSVDSIAQVTAPPAVSSLRQRLGRSGRRGQAAVLRMFITEKELTRNSHMLDRLRVETVQCVAMVSLLLGKWYEPPPPAEYHFSTLIQQTLSVIGQYGGVRAKQLWSLLSKRGPFERVNSELYAEFLHALGAADLITQTADGMIVLGATGEKVVGHFSFYAAFSTPEEYRLETAGRVLGSLPISRPLQIGECLVFAGQRWQVTEVDADRKVISLEHAAGGVPPKFAGEGQMVHDLVRQKMFEVYKSGEAPVYLDQQARKLFMEGMRCFEDRGLGGVRLLEEGNHTDIFTWKGDRINVTLAALLRSQGLQASNFGCLIEVANATSNDVMRAANELLSKPAPDPTELAQMVPDTCIEKYDHFLPREILDIGYGARFFDVEGTLAWIDAYLKL